MINNFKIFKKKKILITGHTGFKGSWLVIWLKLYKAKIIGVSNEIPTKPSNYLINHVAKDIVDLRADVRDLNKIKKIILKYKPDFIFHLAAQSLVKTSYKNPIYTWQTNLNGTLNILESLRYLKKKCTAIIVTSDKCYKNIEKKNGYIENDQLSGDDPYSASKASAEILCNSYFKSFFIKKNIQICTVRAGNVIGGGDWSKDRLIPDCVRFWSKNKKVIIRSPNSTRPWQHVFEALFGYLILATRVHSDKTLNGQSFNFGPSKNKNYSVIRVIKAVRKFWTQVKYIIKKDNFFNETNILNLNTHKVKKILKWNCILKFDEMILILTEWYKCFYNDKKNILNFSKKQILYYESLIERRNNEILK